MKQKQRNGTRMRISRTHYISRSKPIMPTESAAPLSQHYSYSTSYVSLQVVPPFPDRDAALASNADERTQARIPGDGFQGTARTRLYAAYSSRTGASHGAGALPLPDLESIIHARFSPGNGGAPGKSDHDLSYVLLQRVEEFSSRLLCEASADRSYIRAPGNSGIEIPKKTAVSVNGNLVNANYMHLHDASGGVIEDPAAIICGFPTNDRLEEHFRMIHALRPSILVVIMEDKEYPQNKSPYVRNGFEGNGIKAVSEAYPEPYAHPLVLGQGGLEAHCLKLSVTIDNVTVVVPAINLGNYPDGTAAQAHALAPFVKLMHDMQIRGDGVKPRLPLIHCHAGVGRSALVICAYLAEYDPNAGSAEALIKAARRSRGDSALYLEEQRTRVGEIFSMKGLPVLEEQRENRSTANLRHIGYADLATRSSGNFLGTMEQAGCLFGEAWVPQKEVKKYLGDLLPSGMPMLMEVMKGRTPVQAILWNQSLDVARNIETGEIFEGTPLSFFHVRMAQRENEYDGVQTTSIYPSSMAGDIAIFAEQGAEEMQCAVAAYSSDLQDASDIFDFLQFLGMPCYRSVEPLSIGNLENEGSILSHVLLNSANLMLEFFDKNSGVVRYTFKNSRDWNQPVVALRYSASENLSLEFASVDDVVSHIKENSPASSNIDILSTHPLPAIPFFSNIESESDDSGSEMEEVEFHSAY